MPLPIHRAILTTTLLFSLTTAHAGDTDTQPGTPDTTSGQPVAITKEKVLVTFNALPAEGDFQVIGPIAVHKRWFGGPTAAIPLLADKARELGANAVVQTKIWLAPAFPANVAPHGSGIAVRIADPALLKRLADDSSAWE